MKKKTLLVLIVIFIAFLATLILILTKSGNEDNSESILDSNTKSESLKDSKNSNLEQNFVLIDAENAKKLIEKNRQNPHFQIIDARTEEEYQTGHIEKAININFESDNLVKKIDDLGREKVYLVYCKTNNKSLSLAQIMESYNFTNVYILESGYLGWLNYESPDN